MLDIIQNQKGNTMTVRNRVLVLDDEVEICHLVSDYLSQSNYDVKFCHDLPSFTELVNTFNPHFIIMDKFIHNKDSVDMIGSMRVDVITKDIPIVLITGCLDFEEKIRAIHIGADDVLVKPFRLEEIGARLQALKRRSSVYLSPQANLSYKHFTINLQKQELTAGDSQKINLTDTEFKILHLLVLSKGHFVAREKLAHKALTARNHNVRTIDVHINSLRSKLGNYGHCIKTLRGRGYMLID